MVERLDLLVELSTLGEYGLAENVRPVVLGRTPPAGPRTRRLREECQWRAGATPCRDGVSTRS
jgi:hypothetical protein